MITVLVVARTEGFYMEYELGIFFIEGTRTCSGYLKKKVLCRSLFHPAAMSSS